MRARVGKELGCTVMLIFVVEIELLLELPKCLDKKPSKLKNNSYHNSDFLVKSPAIRWQGEETTEVSNKSMVANSK